MKRFFTLIAGATLVAGVGATAWSQGGQSGGGGGASVERVPAPERLVRPGRPLETRAQRMRQAAAALPPPAKAGQANCKTPIHRDKTSSGKASSLVSISTAQAKLLGSMIGVLANNLI